jgi:hypothetical protein
MRSLSINRVTYRITTSTQDKFGADVRFRKGLNIVYGPNSLGKTSIVTGIIYCLGAEKSLGIFKSNQNPFKPEFYDTIDGKTIKESYVLVEIFNGEKTYTIARSIINKTNVAGVKECSIDDFDTVSNVNYLIASGEGTAGEGGLQKFLFDFMGIQTTEVPTYDGKSSKIYIENLAPLFFVEQRAGWSQIQARQVTRYGIRDVKKVVFEFLLGLDRFSTHLIEIRKRELTEELRKEEASLNIKEEELIVSINGQADGEVLLVDRTDTGRTSVFDALSFLNEKYEIEVSNIDALGNTESQIVNVGKSQRESLNMAEHQLRKAVDKTNKLVTEIRGYENYIERIQINKYKNRQLKKIEGLKLSINLNSCPVCEASLEPAHEGDCHLCHSELKRRISTPDQNLNFLEDEEKSFKEVLSVKKLELRKVKEVVSNLKSRVKQREEEIDHHTRTYMGNNLAGIRSKIMELDNLKEEIKKYRWVSRKWSELDVQRHRIKDISIERDRIDMDLSLIASSKRDRKILNTMLKHFKSNVKEMSLFKGKEHIIEGIRIDESDNYTPYLENFDIYNIVSSSDNVRIMLSYYLSILQTSLEFFTDSTMRFPNLLILDEPKQQNLDNQSLKMFIALIEALDSKKFQVILTTYSHVSKEKNLFEKYICHEMVNDTDFLLKRVE